MQLEHTTCPLCHTTSAADYDVVFPARLSNQAFSTKVFSARRAPDRIHYQLVKCKHDGLIRSNPILNTNSLAELYLQSEFTYDREVELLTQSYLEVLKPIVMPIGRSARYLEIGCGSGFILEKLIDLGYDNSFGVEPSVDAVSKASRKIQKNITLNVFTADDFEQESFDCIFFFQTLDHIPNPTEFLNQCYSLLRPGGVIVSLHHNFEYWLVRLLNESHPIVDVEHTFLYTPKTTQAMFESQGFLTKEVYSPKQHISFVHAVHLLPLPKMVKHAAKRLLSSVQRSLQVELGNTVYIAEKPKQVVTAELEESHEKIEPRFSERILTDTQKILRSSIVDISFKKKLSHLGSCLTAIDAISAVFSVKRPGDKFVLSSGHAAVALYVVLEQQGLLTRAEIEDRSIHPDRDVAKGISVSTGSLGQGLPIAVGMAIANPAQTIFCMISDGECSEGSIWESLRIIEELQLKNLVCLVNANGHGAYRDVSVEKLQKQFEGFGFTVKNIDGHDWYELITTLEEIKENLKMPPIVFCNTTVKQLPFLNGVEAHYLVMSEDQYQTAKKVWNKQ